MDDSLYDTSRYRQHGLHVAVVNKTQILFVPCLQSHLISEAAAICDFPMDAEEIGQNIFFYWADGRTRFASL